MTRGPQDVHEALAAAGLEIDSDRRRFPLSLEDVFLALIEQRRSQA